MKRIPQPKLIASYNRGMGGVDMLDQLLAAYRPTIRGKKWWWPLFTNVLNVSVVAAWRLYQASHPDCTISHLDFRRNIVICLMKKAEPQRLLQSGHHVDLPVEVRRDGAGHDNDTTNEGRCVVCSKNTKNECIKCNVRLHYSKGKQCFALYHRK